MVRQVIVCAAATAIFGCKAADAVYWLSSNGSIEVSIAGEQSNLCHPDCSTEALQTSPKMDFFIGHRGDRGLFEGPVNPGAYSAPPPEDGGTGVQQWEVGGALTFSFPGQAEFTMDGVVLECAAPRASDRKPSDR